ncbi:MAG: LysM peptidoglycan-binding domain-containing protein [Kiritimatiellaeota bacterium]|nr:LysM peptidoglycan-binding domain-containing protein [Kiritimatiellota bacterium]
MLSRGTYGIEYDENRNTGYQKYGWLTVLIPVLVLIVIFTRSCKPPPNEDPAQATRFDAPEVSVNRESVSLRRHFFGNWFGSSASSTNTPAAALEKDAPPALPKTSKRIPAQIQKLLDQALADEQAGNLADARLTFLHLLGQNETAELYPFIERKIGQINSTLFFSKQPVPGKTTHTVVRGDTPGRIAQRFGCTQEFIMEVNGIERPETMRIGALLQVLDSPVFELRISKADASARLTLNGEFFNRYALVTGGADIPPAGNYTVRNRGKRTLDHSDIWTGLPDDKPRHPQDICWITLSPSGITLQGTRNISADAPAVRFRNPDIDELFLLLPNGTPVVIAE